MSTAPASRPPSLTCLARAVSCLAVVATPALAYAADDVIQLDNVVVTATGFEQMVEDAPASISVISRQELEKRAYRDITDAIKNVPGVVVTGGGSESDISIRGMAPAYT